MTSKTFISNSIFLNLTEQSLQVNIYSLLGVPIRIPLLSFALNVLVYIDLLGFCFWITGIRLWLSVQWDVLLTIQVLE